VNEVLARQLRRLGLGPDAVPDAESWAKLLEIVTRSYDDADRSRYTMERSMRISSAEMRDLTEEIRALSERRIEQSESHYRNLFAQSPIAIWDEDFTRVGLWLDGLRAAGVLDLQDHFDTHPDELRKGISLIDVLDVNSAAVVLVRSPDKASLLGPIDPELYGDDPSALYSFRVEFQAIWDGASRATFEFNGKRSDGTALYGILNWSVPLVDGERDLSRTAVAIIDITERKHAEDQMEELIRSKDAFLASVSHELRTPLTTVYASAETLIDQAEDLDPELQRELIGYIARESGELANMVEDLLVAARAEIGMITLSPSQTELLPVVARVVEIAKLDDEDLDLSCTEVSGSAWVDPLRLKQIIRNLVSNAVRYGGSMIRVQAETIGSRTMITVLDNGNGIPEEHREAIFELYQTGSTAPSVTGSVGVGLAVSRQLADLMGGDIEYEYVGGWSRFRLQLPSTSPERRDDSRPISFLDASRNAS
jgi:signal transduction histidine kinase